MVTSLIKSAKVIAVMFYFIYSVIPSLFALICIRFDVPVYFWMLLPEDVQVQLASIQIVGFFVLLATLPRINKEIHSKKMSVQCNENIIAPILALFSAYAILPLILLVINSQGVSERNQLFAISAGLSSLYKLNFIFLFSTILILYKSYYSKNIRVALYLIPFVLFDAVSLGRVWIFTSLILLLFLYVLCYEKAPNFKKIGYMVGIFIALSLARLGREILNVDFGGILIYMLGEAFNTSQSIEIAYISGQTLGFPTNFGMIASEFIPFGLKGLVINPDNLSINIIDNAKSDVYGADIEMGFGSSWFSQAIINFGVSWLLIFLPLFLSISLHLAVRIFRASEMLGLYYLFFYASGMFIFMRYGLNLALSYPATNLLNTLMFLLFLSFFPKKIFIAKARRVT